MAENIKECDFMFRQACAFAECGKHCEIELLPFSMRKSNFIIAGMVNSALACEIFLKTLLYYYTNSHQDGHELSELWKKLQGENKKIADEISAAVDSFYSTSQSNIVERVLEIKNISNTFSYWRYIYEHLQYSETVLELKQKRSNGIELNDKEKKQLETYASDPNFVRIFREVLKAKCCEILFDCSWDEYINR